MCFVFRLSKVFLLTFLSLLLLFASSVICFGEEYKILAKTTDDYPRNLSIDEAIILYEMAPEGLGDNIHTVDGALLNYCHWIRTAAVIEKEFTDCLRTESKTKACSEIAEAFNGLSNVLNIAIKNHRVELGRQIKQQKIDALLEEKKTPK